MKLYDQLNRCIDYLRVSITDRCNLSCIYCKPRVNMKPLPHPHILRYEEMLRVVSVSASLGITHIRITGGEPLVRRGVIDFITSLKSIEGIDDISLTTNGVLLADMAGSLRDAGISRLNISLDSLDARKFRQITGKDSWNEVWRGIERAEEIGFAPIKINMVPVKGINDDEIADFARLTLKRALHVRFIEFMPIGGADRWQTDKCVSSDQIRDLIERQIGTLTACTTKQSAGPSSNYQISGARGVIGFISPISKHFCAACRRLRLTADGKIRPCLLSDTEIDIKSPLRGGCDDRELERLLKLALQIKPERHYLNVNAESATCFQRTMSRIGG
jgi:cyclic pyranopterin phosphate synthase